MVDRLRAEIEAVNAHTRAMLVEYVAWGDKIVTGDVHQHMYRELIDFLNFRMETADTCMQLAEHERVADSLGLCRSLLEHYLLFMLMCRGHKYFQLQDCATLTEGEFKKLAAQKQTELAEALSAGTPPPYMAVKKYARAKRQLMYVFEGLAGHDEPDFMVPVHYFHFQDFNPQVMRLKDGDYFEYVEHTLETKNILAGHQREAVAVYKAYLSYDGLLTCLELNDLVDAAAIARIEAHYTFLGQFLHPTYSAARDLHENSNYYEGQPVIGMHSPYKPTAQLLASLYVCYLVAGLLREIALIHDNAPSRYIADPGTGQLHQLIDEVARKFPYFWFLFNEPPLYDKFLHYSTQTTVGERESIGHYANMPADKVLFNQHIFSHFEQSLTSWSNAAAGVYHSPLQ